jgi:hypothetical protein
MHHINPEKSLNQVELRTQVAKDFVVPKDWFNRLCAVMADDILKLAGQAKADFFHHLKRHAGPQSGYTLKPLLHESLRVIYETLVHPAVSSDQKSALALKILEGAPNCTAGFHDRCNELIISLSVPKNLDDLLSVQRQAIVSRAANQTTNEVHAYNRFFVLAQGMGFGVRPMNPNDHYQGLVSDQAIIAKLKESFAEQYTMFTILGGLSEQIALLLRDKGYTGRRAGGYVYEDYQKFNSLFLKEFVGIKSDYDLFIYDEEGEDLIPNVLDINWLNIKTALLKKMREEKYFIFTPQEEALLQWMEGGDLPLELTPEALSLFATPDELLQVLVFFKEMPTAKKVELLRQYINEVPEGVSDDLFDKLEKNAELIKEIGSGHALQTLLLAKAFHGNKLDKVIALVASGADINPYLGVLLQRQKKPMLQWLMSDAAVRDTITENSLHVIAETLLNSKKGRQILVMDERLRGMCPDLIAGKSMKKWMWQAEAELITRMREGFFAPVNPIVQQFLQHIIYGEQAQAKKILEDHPQMMLELLTTKLKVKDYSGRKIFGTALQLALGAEDVRYHEDEICMVEMLTPYIKSLPDGEKLMAAQIAEQFPEGYEEQEQQRIRADEAALIKVLDAIGRSNNDAECEPALQEFDNYLKPKGIIRTGKHFNEKLQEMAYELYDKRYDEFGGSWDSRKNLLTWRRVNGRIQRNYTACLAQAASQGLYYIVDEGEKLQRTLELRNNRGVRFYPLDLNPASRLGFDYAIAELGAGWRGMARLRARRRAAGFQNLVEQKTRSLERLMPQREKQSGKCVVM